MESDFYTVVFIINQHEFYTIWICDKEIFVTDFGKILLFKNEADVRKYAIEHNLPLSDEECTVYNVDGVNQWVLSGNSSVDCDKILNFWNIVQDVARTVDTKFLGDKQTSKIDRIYNMLFYGTNILADEDDELYIPEWSEVQLELLRKIILDGVRILQELMIERGGTL